MWQNGIATFAGCSGVKDEHKDVIKHEPIALHKGELVHQNENQAYCGIILTPDNRKKVASIIKNLRPEDYLNLECNLDLDTSHHTLGDDDNRRVTFHMRKGARLRSVSVEESNAFFQKLNSAFEKAQAHGLDSSIGLRTLKPVTHVLNCLGSLLQKVHLMKNPDEKIVDTERMSPADFEVFRQKVDELNQSLRNHSYTSDRTKSDN